MHIRQRGGSSNRVTAAAAAAAAASPHFLEAAEPINSKATNGSSGSNPRCSIVFVTNGGEPLSKAEAEGLIETAL